MGEVLALPNEELHATRQAIGAWNRKRGGSKGGDLHEL